MVGVAFLADFIAVGFLFYSFGVFITAIEPDLGVSRAEISIALALSNLVGAFAAPLLGRLLDRSSIRWVMGAGAVLMASGFLLLSRVDAIWQLHLLFATFLAVGASTMGGLASAKLVANWFERRRGTALGIATMGISLSGLLMPPGATWLIKQLGWRSSFLVYAGLTLLIVLPPVLLLVVNRPEDIGQRPDGDAPPDDTEPDAPPARIWATRELLRSGAFWGSVLPFALGFFANSAVLTHLVPHALSLGIEEYRAASLLSFAAGAGVAGKVAFGRIADRSGPRFAIALSLALQLVGVAALVFARRYAALVPIAALFGFGMGGMVPLQGTLLGSLFGRSSFGKVMGLIRPVQVPIHAIGIPFAGFVFVRLGSYDAAFQVFVIAYALALAALLGVRTGTAR